LIPATGSNVITLKLLKLSNVGTKIIVSQDNNFVSSIGNISKGKASNHHAPSWQLIMGTAARCAGQTQDANAAL